MMLNYEVDSVNSEKKLNDKTLEIIESEL